MKTMYPAIVNSPQTELASAITDTDTTIPLLDASVLPDPPNICTIGTGEDAETVLYTGVSGNDLTGVTRGFQGAAKSWGAGVKVARLFTEYDYDALRQNILSRASRDELSAHLAESVIHRRIFIGYDEPLDAQEGDIWLDLNPPRKILADWRMLETVGEQVIDYSGNGYHGTIIGNVERVSPINEGSLSALKGDGETGYVQTNFNALAGLDNFKVEVFVVINGLKPGATNGAAGWNGIVNHYRTSGTTPQQIGYHISYNEWRDINEPEARKGSGFAARIIAINSDNELVHTNYNLFSYIYADFGDVYKLTLEFDGKIGIATFKVEKVLSNGQLEHVWYGSSLLSGIMPFGTNPLNLMATNTDEVYEHGNITLGRVTISTKMR